MQPISLKISVDITEKESEKRDTATEGTIAYMQQSRAMFELRQQMKNRENRIGSHRDKQGEK